MFTLVLQVATRYRRTMVFHRSHRRIVVAALGIACAVVLIGDAAHEAAQPCPRSYSSRLADIVADLTVAGGRFHVRSAPHRATFHAFSNLELSAQLLAVRMGGPPTSAQVHTRAAATGVVGINSSGFVVDGWGNPIVYDAEQEDFSLTSYGDDGRPGGICEAADVHVIYAWTALGEAPVR